MAHSTFEQKPKIERSLCAECGLCVELCELVGTAVLKMVDGRPEVSPLESCYLCSECIEICPNGALALQR